MNENFREIQEQQTDLTSLISSQKPFLELFKQLELKPNQIELIRAFMVASQGEIEFEASYWDLAKILYSKGGQYEQRWVDRVKYHLEGLQNWQDEKGINLIQVIKKGDRKKSLTDGKFITTKSKYRFVLLDELNQDFNNNSENLELAVKRTIERVKEQFIPSDKRKKYPSGVLMKRAKETVLTKMEKIFEFALESGIDAENYCRKIISQCLELVTDLQNKTKAEQHRQNFLLDFRTKYLTKTLEKES